MDVRMGLQLLAMLFCRPTELREAKWQEFDLNQGIWNIPAERMKKRREHVVPLPRQAITILNELKLTKPILSIYFRADQTRASQSRTQFSLWPCAVWGMKVDKHRTDLGTLPAPC